MGPNSFVSAALREQKSMNLPWYRNIKPLLKCDEIYSLDHVTANKIKHMKSSNLATSSHVSKREIEMKFYPRASRELLESMSMLQTAKPLPSKQFRVYRIIEILEHHFVKAWEYEKSNSSKLSFYHSCKSSFGREPYLDISKGFNRRYSTTKLRISAHDLQIETGRYKNIPRASRFCEWCKINLGQDLVEDESHVLTECDLYSKSRSKLFDALKKTPSSVNDGDRIGELDFTKISHSSILDQLMTLLSPNSPIADHPDLNIFNHHHRISSENKIKHQTQSGSDRRSYIVNCICTYINSCFNDRWKVTKHLRDAEPDSCQTLRIHITH